MAYETQPQHFILWKLETCWTWDDAMICRVIIQTIPNGPDQQSAPHCWPFDHAMICRVIIQTIPCSPFLLAHIKNQALIHLKHSLNTFSAYLLQPLRWMQTSSETSATETTERRCKNTKTRSTWTTKHHESSKLEHITECHDLDRQSEL